MTLMCERVEVAGVKEMGESKGDGRRVTTQVAPQGRLRPARERLSKVRLGLRDRHHSSRSSLLFTRVTGAVMVVAIAGGALLSACSSGRPTPTTSPIAMVSQSIEPTSTGPSASPVDLPTPNFYPNGTPSPRTPDPGSWCSL